MSFIDRSFGVSPQILTMREQRFKLIAGNLANSDTPGYKAVDIGFEQLLKQSRVQPVSLQATRNGHLGGNGLNGQLMYRIPTQPKLDGNTVETSIEHSEFMQNAIRYQASLSFLDSRIQGLRKVLRGE